MYSVVLLFVLLAAPLTSVFAQTSEPSGAPRFQEADQLFTFGEDAARDKQALAVIERALAADAANYQWLWRAARVCYFVGEEADRAEKPGYFDRGIDAGRRAVAREPNAVEGHFWLAVNYGGYSEQKGVFKALMTVRKIRSGMETVLRLNDRYQDGGAYLALGEMDRQLPRLVGGNLGRAIARLEQGVRVAPHNLEIRLALGRALEEAGRKTDAKRELQDLLGRAARSGAERRIQEKARLLLARM
jgi:Tetratricopeptide repeat